MVSQPLSSAKVPTYLPFPSCAIPIPPPSPTSSSISRPTPIPLPPLRHRSPSFPPPTSTPSHPKAKGGLSAPSFPTNVSDMLLSTLLPPNLPKLPSTNGRPAGIGASGGGEGVVRELTTRREGLAVQVMGNNFRRFVIKVGPLFWLQDRIEEVLYWRKPVWTWAWLGLWTFISFQPRVLLLLPSAILLVMLLHMHERTTPLPSLLGVSLPAASIGTMRYTTAGKEGTTYSASTAPDGEGVPVVPPKEAESGVDFFMNLQAIQNLMGLASDLYDWVVPRLQLVSTPATTPTTFPITPTHVIFILLPPTLLLPLVPSALIPYLILPIGTVFPLALHPNIFPLLSSLSRDRIVLRFRDKLEDLVLTDGLSDELGRKELGKVAVWENERLDPAAAGKPSAPGTTLPHGAWGAKYLRAGERAPWVKVVANSTLWGTTETLKIESQEQAGEEGKVVLALKEGWKFIPGEAWRVDLCLEASDEDGWVYYDDSWQNPASEAMTAVDVSPLGGGREMPGMAFRRVTRRRRWRRRVYLDRDID